MATVARTYLDGDRIGPSVGKVAARPRAVRVLQVSASILALTGLGLARILTRGGSLDMIYGEDGSAFLPDELRHGLLASLGRPYQGYLHTVPRVLAALIALFPLSDAAVATACAAALTTALLATFVYFASENWIPSRLLRGGLAVAMVALPVAREEVASNLANLQWPLLFAAFWALLVDDDNGARWLAPAVACGAALSSPISLMLVPVALVRVLSRSAGFARLTSGAFLCAATLQLSAMLLTGGDRTITGGGIHDGVVLVERFAGRAVGGVLWWPASPGATVVPTLLGVGLFALLACWGAHAYLHQLRHAALAILLLVLAVALFIAPAFETGTPSRYSYVPALMLLSAVALVPPVHGRALVVALGVLGLVWLSSFSASVYRVDGPSWSDSIAAARRSCAHGTTVRIPIGPYQAPNQLWRHTVYPCSSL